ncbi:MAG: tRNA (adenosine(37)-N6)-threonylcarbamoyltransferase complex ATPase subunit type 1 TsaE [Gemmatimonadetes bacterium]|nr:tRNA (adenosine(37)-N6)-threonylcarbamoyltransferase complex ATPase subunit type 1 TsaE [Gemmatimonadota bacterium]
MPAALPVAEAGADVVAAEELAHLLGRGAPRAPDRDSLEAWGRAVGALLPRPATIALEGDLGAGKTTLVRALAQGLGVLDLEAVTSPTFALVHRYDAPRGPVVHVDLYRLKGPEELDALGWDELVDTSPVLLIEWPDRAANSLPRDTITIVLSHDPSEPGRRSLRVLAPAHR